MTFRTERCPVGANIVTLVSDFEGTIAMVICPDYEYASGTCAQRRRGRGASPLTTFIERVSACAVPDATNRCLYWPA